jgi:hypothetical protein
MEMKFFRALTLTLFLFGLLGWIYIALNAVFHPESLSWPLTHVLPFPREDTFGIMCFIVSSVSFFIWNMIRKEK